MVTSPVLRVKSMQFKTSSCRLPRVLASSVTLCLSAGCGSDASVAPQLPDASAAAPFGAVAFTATIDLRARSVVVTPPPRGGTVSPRTAVADPDAAMLSLLGSDVIRLVTSNVRISPVGAFAPNRRRVTFDIAIENRLPCLALTIPTWPEPPAQAVILFPITSAATQSPGSVTGTDGNAVDITLPGSGTVVPSPNWNGTGATGSGAPYNFFTTAPCAAEVTASCLRWISVGTRIEPGLPRETRTVGFDMDASVAQFRTRMIVAADLAPAAIRP
jgi:hypothetical protein